MDAGSNNARCDLQVWITIPAGASSRGIEIVRRVDGRVMGSVLLLPGKHVADLKELLSEAESLCLVGPPDLPGKAVRS